MLKVGIHSVTHPQPGVERLDLEAQADTVGPTPTPQVVPPAKKPAKRLHEVIAGLKTAQMAPAMPPAPTVQPQTPPPVPPPPKLPPVELPPKTTDAQISLSQRAALADVSESSTGAPPKSEIDSVGSIHSDEFADANQAEIEAGKNRYNANRYSLYSAKAAALDRAELLAELLLRGISKAGAAHLSSILVKAALGVGEGIGNMPQAGQQAVPREAEASRQAIGKDIVRTGGGMALPKGTAFYMKTHKPIYPTPALNALLSRGLKPEANPYVVPLTKTNALMVLARGGLRKEAVLDFIRVSRDKKAALLTLGRIKQASERRGRDTSGLPGSGGDQASGVAARPGADAVGG
jgi:hypothetical protein